MNKKLIGSFNIKKTVNGKTMRRKFFQKLIVPIETNMILLIICFSSFSSCEFNSTPKCGDKKVKEGVLIEFNKSIKPIILKHRIEDSLNYSDLKAYASDNGLDYLDLLNDKKEELKKEFNDEVDLGLSASKLINIRTDKIEKDINKCGCSGEISNPELKEIEIRYSAQKIEDSKEGIYITIDYNVKKTDQ